MVIGDLDLNIIARLWVITKVKKSLMHWLSLIKNTKLTVLCVTPLGDPIEILIRGFNLNLKKLRQMLLLWEGVK